MAPNVLQENFDVDYVIKFNVDNKDKATSSTKFQQLIRSLAEVGLETEVRHGDKVDNLFIFVKAGNNQVLADVVYRARIRDWLHGVRHVQPVKETVETLKNDPMKEAERLRMIHGMITCSREDGGAGITPGIGDWKCVEAIFPLHNHTRNKKWLTEFASKTFLTPEDLDQVRDTVGEKIAYYYAFLQSYFRFLMFPAAFGLSVKVLFGNFSPIYAIVNGLWCVIFVEYWKRQEAELAIRWDVRNVGRIESKRREFRPDKSFRDPVTKEEIHYFPPRERLKRQALQIPLALASAITLGVIICTCYGIEIFISEVYDGPFKSVLVFTPTILLTLFVPTVSNFLTNYAARLTDYENYETQHAHDKALVSKVFVINFITSYLAIFLTSFVYVPFAAILVPYLDIFSLTVQPFAETDEQMKAPAPNQFNINPQRLPNQMFYFAVTAQVVNFAMETIMPIVTKKGADKYKSMSSSSAKSGSGAGTDFSISANDPQEEKDFLARVREEAALPAYDVTSDLREMCIQFGYLALFSVVWPLTPVSYFINNWVELRGDTFKLTVESRRPNPERADSIGPWLDSLEFLAWLGSITSAALVYMFSNGGLGPDGRPGHIKLGLLLLAVFTSEHTYLVVRLAVRTAISKLDSPNMRQERAERFMIRRKYLEEAGLGDAVKPLTTTTDSPLASKFEGAGAGAGLEKGISREQLEEDARNESLHDSSPSTRFWGRQRGWQESIAVGGRMIELMESDGEKKMK